MVFSCVVERELRAAARQPLTHGLRMLGAAAAVLALGLAGCRHDMARMFPGVDPAQQLGAALFGYLNALLYGLVWAAVPLITADCLARERREGTLGLLFLTPLKTREVVAGKSLAHGLRAWTVVLAAAPVMTAPLFLGGLEWRDLLMALLINTGAMMLALGAGLAASAVARERTGVVVLAELFSGLLGLAYTWVQGSAYVAAAATVKPGAGPSLFWRLTHGNSGVLGSVYDLFSLATNLGMQPTMVNRTLRYTGRWSEVWTSAPGAAQTEWFIKAAFWMAAGAAGLALAAAFAAWRARVWWREPDQAPEGGWSQRLWRPLGSPAGRRLEGCNPAGWTPLAARRERLRGWIWCLAVVLAEMTLALNLGDLGRGQFWVFFALLAGMAFEGAASFSKERESGALELLLVTPLSAARIIGGRAGRQWAVFGPAVAVMLFIWGAYRGSSGLWVMARAEWAGPLGWLASGMGGFGEAWDAAGVFLLGSAIILPVCGMLGAARRRTIWGAWAWAMAAGLGAPMVLSLWLRGRMGEMNYLLGLGFALGAVVYAARPPSKPGHYRIWVALILGLAAVPWLLTRHLLPLAAQATGLAPDALVLLLTQLAAGGICWRLLHHQLENRRSSLARPGAG